MKRTIEYKAGNKTVQREINYIPVRYILAALVTVLEILLIIGAVIALCYFVPYFYLACWATQIACVIKIISSDDNPDYKVPWLLFVLILPVAGFMLYFLFASRKIGKKQLRRIEELKALRYEKDDSPLFSKLKKTDPAAFGQANMLCAIAEAHPFCEGKQTYFPLGEDMWKSLLSDLKTAQKFIYMEYFIIEEGKFWNSILEILKEKAGAGVEVKVVYDDIGCMSTLPGNYAKILKKSGIAGVPFSRLKGQADGEFNNRSHRKITVIDGRIGYTGGVNIADEYVNEKVRFGHWKDTAIRLEGEAVWELTRLFLCDYGFNTKAPPSPREDWYPESRGEGDGVVIPFGDGPSPLYRRRVAKSVLQSMLSSARESAYLTTPYLIMDNDLCQSIENAALRGVDVRLVLPGIPDKKMVYGISRSFYPRLLAAGVKIYEYTPGFIHAKSYLVDGKYALIGTVNLDYRSLVHHFENGVWLCGGEGVQALKQDIQNVISVSEEITSDKAKASLLSRAFRAIGRIFAPLL